MDVRKAAGRVLRREQAMEPARRIFQRRQHRVPAVKDRRAVVLEGHQARQVDRGLGAVAIAVGEGRGDEHHAVIQQLR